MIINILSILVDHNVATQKFFIHLKHSWNDSGLPGEWKEKLLSPMQSDKSSFLCRGLQVAPSTLLKLVYDGMSVASVLISKEGDLFRLILLTLNARVIPVVLGVGALCR